MDSSTINANNGALAASTITNSAKELGKEDFLKLLAVQLQYQDPMDPMDNTEFISQMAQFSSLEGITNMSENLQGLSDQMLSMNNMNVTNLIGKDVKVFGDSLELTEAGADTNLGYLLMDQASKVDLSILDSNGTEVRKLSVANAAVGPGKILWDGNDASGNPVAPGSYSFTVNAVNSDGGPVKSNSIMTKTVDGVVYEDSIPYLMVGGRMVGINDILEVWGQ